MNSNFDFLNEKWPDLAEVGKLAEAYLYSDPNSSMTKSGMLAEEITEHVFDLEGMEIPIIDGNQYDLINRLFRERLIDEDMKSLMHSIRKTRNDAQHEHISSFPRALAALKQAHKISVWFMEVYGDWGYTPEPFVQPENLAEQPDYSSRISELETRITELADEVDRLREERRHAPVYQLPEEGRLYAAGMRISDTDISVRAKNALLRSGYGILRDIAGLSAEEIGDICNIGAKTRDEILQLQKQIVEDSRLVTPQETASEHVQSEADHPDDGVVYPADMLIAVSDLSNRAKNAMQRAGLTYMGELLKMDDEAIGEIRSIGAKTRDELIFAKKHVTEEMVRSQNEDIADKEALLLNYLICHDIPTANYAFSTRAANTLQKKGIDRFSQIVEKGIDAICSTQGVGRKTVEEITAMVEEVLQPIRERITRGEITEENYRNRTAEEDDAFVMDIFMAHSGIGLSFRDILEDAKGAVTIPHLSEILGRLMSQGKIMLDEEGNYSLFVPHFLDVVKMLDNERERDILTKRVSGSGMTLEEVGQVLGVTRERIRQIENKALEHTQTLLRNRYRTEYFREDSCRRLYEKYFVTKEEWNTYFGLPAETYNYLGLVCGKKGELDLADALSDDSLSRYEKKLLQGYISHTFIEDNGVLIPRKRIAIEEYLVATKCMDRTRAEDFFRLYETFIEKHGLQDDNRLKWSDDIIRTRLSKLGASPITLWVQGKQFRYYDTGANDYTDLYNALSLDSYKDIEISTLKLLRMYPNVMKEYDIRDEYELHNLIRKTYDPERYPEMTLGRAPTLRFGNFDRDYIVFSTMVDLAPITWQDLAKAIEAEYGFSAATVAGSWFGPIQEYYHNGFFTIGDEDMPEEQKEALRMLLKNDFYFTSDIKKIYLEQVAGAQEKYLTPYNLKKMGWSVKNRYAYKGWNSSKAYFTHLLTEKDEVDISDLRKRFATITEFTNTLAGVRDTYEIIETEKDRYVNFRVLEKQGFTKEDFRRYCDEVAAFAGTDYFTMHSLRNSGFEPSVTFGYYGDTFYESLLREDPRFRFQWTAGLTIFQQTQEPVDRRTLIMDVIRKEEAIQIDDLITLLKEYYGVYADRWDVTEAIRNTDIRYDLADGILMAEKR